MINKLDRSRPHVLNTHLGSKYHYTPDGMSPTVWAYAHPDHPKLPSYLSREEIDRNYKNSIQALTHLEETVLPENPGRRFVNSQDVIDLAAPPEYWIGLYHRRDVDLLGCREECVSSLINQ